MLKCLQKYPQAFKGGLSTLKIKPIRLEIKADTEPYHARPFQVPCSLEGTTKREINRLETIGVLEKKHSSEWAAPTFVIPKETGDVRIVTNFCQLNKVIKRKSFPLPKIADLLQKLVGFQYATAIDLSMSYYHVPLDEKSGTVHYNSTMG